MSNKSEDYRQTEYAKELHVRWRLSRILAAAVKMILASAQRSISHHASFKQRLNLPNLLDQNGVTNWSCSTARDQLLRAIFKSTVRAESQEISGNARYTDWAGNKLRKEIKNSFCSSCYRKLVRGFSFNGALSHTNGKYERFDTEGILFYKLEILQHSFVSRVLQPNEKQLLLLGNDIAFSSISLAEFVWFEFGNMKLGTHKNLETSQMFDLPQQWEFFVVHGVTVRRPMKKDQKHQ